MNLKFSKEDSEFSKQNRASEFNCLKIEIFNGSRSKNPPMRKGVWIFQLYGSIKSHFPDKSSIKAWLKIIREKPRTSGGGKERFDMFGKISMDVLGTDLETLVLEDIQLVREIRWVNPRVGMIARLAFNNRQNRVGNFLILAKIFFAEKAQDSNGIKR